MSETIDKSGFEEAIANMAASSTNYHKEYVFYAHMIAQCRIVYDEKLGVTEDNPNGSAAAVNFMHDHYNLYINPNRFNELPLETRLGVLKHEMLHITNNHVMRNEDRDTSRFQYASDCAINQHINPEHLPDNAVTPNNFPSQTGQVPPNMTAEQYYEMIPEQENGNDGNGQGNGQGEGQSKGQGEGNPPPPGNHDAWNESQGEEIIQKDLTKKMLEKSASEAQKSRGDMPGQYADWLNLFDTSKQVNWKQVLRRITGNKKVGARKTLLRRDRRNPGFEHIKGRTKDRMFELLVVGDESGSVSDKELTQAVKETVNLCRTMNTDARYIAVDSKAYPSIELNKRTRSFERQARGGTYISTALNQAKKERIKYDALLIITDGYLCESDVEKFKSANVPTIFLITSDGTIMDSMQDGKMRAIKLEDGE